MVKELLMNYRSEYVYTYLCKKYNSFCNQDQDILFAISIGLSISSASILKLTAWLMNVAKEEFIQYHCTPA